MNRKINENNKKSSLFIKSVNAFVEFIYSLFANSSILKVFSNKTDLYERSFLGRTLKKKHRSLNKNPSGGALAVIENSADFKFFGAVNHFLTSLSLNVYGVFFTVYGICSILMHYISIAVKSNYSDIHYALPTSIIITVCALPMLSTSNSVTLVINESRFVKRFVLSFLGLPAEKLRENDRISGTEIVFLSGLLAVLFGVFTYFLHPAYLLIIFGLLIILCLVFTNPESGVVLTVAMAPFLQYTSYAKHILVSMILLVMFSYVLKLIRRRRSAYVGALSIIFMIFCAFVLLPSLFTKGGGSAIVDAATSTIIIFGGFYLTYNLIRRRKILDVCVSTLTVSFVLICLSGLLNLLYNAIGSGVAYSIKESVQPIFEHNVIYISDTSAVFSVFAVMLFPLVLSLLAGKKNFKSEIFSLIVVALCVIATFIYGNYEAVVVIAIEFCAFWLLYSHKTVSAVIFASIPIAILLLLYPFAELYLGFEDIGTVIKNILPISEASSSVHTELSRNVIEMLKDTCYFGIGVGEEAFVEAFKDYSNMISEGALSPTSFYLQLLCWTGIGGAVTFIGLIVIIVWNSFCYLASSKNKDIKLKILPLLCTVIFSLIFGFVNPIWNDCRMMYLFWVCLGLLAGYVKEGREAEKLEQTEFKCSDDSTDIKFKL